MKPYVHVKGLAGLSMLSLVLAGSAFADTVQSTAVVYAAGTQSGVASGAGGTAPTAVGIVGGTSYLNFGVSGSIVLNNGTGNNTNDADGVGAVPSTSYNSGSGSISGLSAPGAGYLTGVFVGSGGPSGTAPGGLDFGTASLGTDFSSLSPLLDQAFFIGDGLTGDGTGTLQNFYVPNGATTLYLGISDACAYNGGPSCYSDNVGSYTVNTVQVPGTVAPVTSVTPEPSSLLLLGTGALGMLGAARRRLARN